MTVAGVLAAILALLAWEIWFVREPGYQGKTLRRWLREAYEDPQPFEFEHPECRPAAMKAVCGIGRDALPTLLRMMRAEDSPLVERLPAALCSPSRRARALHAQAAFGLCALGPEAAGVVPELTPLCLARADWSTMVGLAGVGPAGVLAVSQALTNQSLVLTNNPSLRLTIFNVLEQRARTIWQQRLTGMDSPPRLEAEMAMMQPSLEGCLAERGVDSTGMPIRYRAAQLLILIGRREDQAVRVLTEGFANKDPRIRQRAGWILAMLGPAGKPAVPVLLKALSDPEKNVRAIAASAIGKIGLSGAQASEAVPLLLENVRDEDARLRAQVVTALGGIPGAGDPGGMILPALAKVLQDTNDTVRACAAQAIGRISPQGQAADEVAPALEKALDDADLSVRAAAARALDNIRRDRTRGTDPRKLRKVMDG